MILTGAILFAAIAIRLGWLRPLGEITSEITGGKR